MAKTYVFAVNMLDVVGADANSRTDTESGATKFCGVKPSSYAGFRRGVSQNLMLV